MFYTKELSSETLQRGGANVPGFLGKEEETALGSTTCLGGKILRFGEKWHRIRKLLEAWTRVHWRRWEQCQLTANCGLSRFWNSSKGGKLNEAFFPSSPPTDSELILRDMWTLGPFCLHPSGASKSQPWLVWFGMGRRLVQEVGWMKGTCF